MSNIIIQIDDFSFHVNHESDINGVLACMTVIYGWANSRMLIKKSVCEAEPYKLRFDALESGKLKPSEFARNCLDGVVCKDVFKARSVSEFVNDYIETGTFYYELEYYFEVKSFTKVPDDWKLLKAFYESLDTSFEDAIENYK